MSDLYWLTDDQMARLEPYFPKSHGKPRVDDRRVLSGIIFVNRNGLRWRDAPREYGPHKTLYNRWGQMGVFTRMMEGLFSAGVERKTVMIDPKHRGRESDLVLTLQEGPSRHPPSFSRMSCRLNECRMSDSGLAPAV